jgi:hypothetical protein
MIELMQSACLPSAERYFLDYGAPMLALRANIGAQRIVKYQSDHRRLKPLALSAIAEGRLKNMQSMH